jgi:hypothetical protein
MFIIIIIIVITTITTTTTIFRQLDSSLLLALLPFAARCNNFGTSGDLFEEPQAPWSSPEMNRKRRNVTNNT